MMVRKLVISINSTWNFVNFRAGLLRALAGQGYELVAVAPDDGYVDELTRLHCRYLPVKMKRRTTSVIGETHLLAQYAALLRRERPCAQLTFTIKPNIYGSLAARAYHIPSIANVAGLGTTFLQAGPLNRLVRAMYSAALRPSPITFFQNDADRELFSAAGIVRRERSRLLPGSGVDLHRFSPRSSASDVPGPIFLLLGRFLWAKGLAEYADAARAIRLRHPSAEFRLLGMPETGAGAVDGAQLLRWQQEGVMRIFPAVDDVRPALADADCVVLPSFYPEGTPRSLLEAAAMGRPIITTNVPGCRDIVEDGQNGYLCEPRDAMSLRQAIERFVSLGPTERQEMGRKSRAAAENRFDEQIVINAYLSALDEVCWRSRGR